MSVRSDFPTSLYSSQTNASFFGEDKQNHSAMFPIFQSNPGIVFLDSAATTQKPFDVLKAERTYVETIYANSGRGSYPWAYQTSNLIGQTRESIASFIGGNSNEVIFTSGATMSLNLVALSWGNSNLNDGDEILYCPEDHQSLNSPWFLLQQKLASREINIRLKPYSLLTSGAIDTDSLISNVTKRTRLVNLTHINNVAGIVNDIKHIRSLLPRQILLNLDCAQSITHTPLNVADMDLDFASLSGHKFYSSTGVGILWINKKLHSQLQPVFSGSREENSKDSLAHIFEHGTLNTLGIISLAAALEFIEKIGLDVFLKHNSSLANYLYKALLEQSNVELIYPKSVSPSNRAGPIAFNIKNYNSAEIGDYLSAQNIFVRHGTHCTGNKETSLSSSQNSVRASFAIYNSLDDIDRLLKALRLITSKPQGEHHHFSQ